MKKHKNEFPRIRKLPDRFEVFPCGSSPTDGRVNVDLGEWETDKGQYGRFYMTVDTKELKELVRKIMKAPGQSKCLGYGSIYAFRGADRIRR